MSKGLAEQITQVFKPQAPLWACEVTSKHVIVAGVNARRNQVAGRIAVDLPPGKNIEAARYAMRQALTQAGFKGSEIAVVVPDEMARIAFLTVEKPFITCKAGSTKN